MRDAKLLFSGVAINFLLTIAALKPHNVYTTAMGIATVVHVVPGKILETKYQKPNFLVVAFE